MVGGTQASKGYSDSLTLWSPLASQHTNPQPIHLSWVKPILRSQNKYTHPASQNPKSQKTVEERVKENEYNVRASLRAQFEGIA